MLGRLQRHGHPGRRAELPGPHAGAVDDVLGLDVAERRPHAGHRAARGQERRSTGTPSMIRDPALAGALGQRHGHVDRVDPTVVGDVEAGQHVVGAGQREQVLDLAGRDLLHVDAAAAG